MIPLNRRRITGPNSNRGMYGTDWNDFLYRGNRSAGGLGSPGTDDLVYRNPRTINPMDRQNLNYQDDRNLPIQIPGASDRFGAGVKLPEYQMPQTAPEQKPPWDYDEELREASKKGANRLAYEKAAKEESPRIPISKWDRLGSILAAAGTTFATGGDIKAGMTIGRSAFEDTQKEWDDRYDRKVQNLGRLAAADDVDMDRKLRALESKRDNWFKTQQNNRENVDQGRAMTADERANELRRLQMRNIEDEMARRDVVRWTDPKTGITWKKNEKTNEITQVAKTELSEAEKLDYEEKKAAAQAEGGWPTDKKRIQAQSTARTNEATAEATARAALQTQKDTAAAARLISRLQAEAAAMSPDDRYKQGKLELIAAIAAKPSLGGLLGPKNEAGGDTVQDDNTWLDSEETLQDKAQLRAIVNKVAGKAATPASPNVPGVGVGTTKPDANNPGGYPVGTDNMVEVTAPNGEKTKLTPFQAHAFKQKYPTAKIKGVDYK